MSDSDSNSPFAPAITSTRPYLVRAMVEWCCDNGFTPYVAAYVDGSVQVPREFVKNNEIVLNISMEATSNLHLSNEFISFSARFSGTAREIMVPMDRVMAVYARENGQGMTFPVSPTAPVAVDAPEKSEGNVVSLRKAPTPQTQPEPPAPEPAPSGPSRGGLKRVK